MPKFMLEKLVRDKLPEEYKKDGQIAKFKTLSKDQLSFNLKNKLAEEVQELVLSYSKQEMIIEFADIKQVYEDLMSLYDISDNDVTIAQKKKFDKKGGFLNGVYLETLELSDGDKWVEYYRKDPDTYPEIEI